MHDEGMTPVGLLIQKGASFGNHPHILLEAEEGAEQGQEEDEDDDDDDLDETLDRIASDLDSASRYGAENDPAVLELRKRYDNLKRDVDDFSDQLPEDEDDRTTEQTQAIESFLAQAKAMEDELGDTLDRMTKKYAVSWASLARQAAEQEIAKLSSHVARLSKINPKNPAVKVSEELESRVATASDIKDDRERAETYDEIRKEAEAELRKCRECKTAETAVNRAFVEVSLLYKQVEPLLPAKAKGFGAVKPVPARIAFEKAEKAVGTALGRANGLDDLKQKLDAAVPEMNGIKLKIEAALAEKLPLAEQKPTAQAAIDAARDVIKDISPEDVQLPLQERLNALFERQQAANQEPDSEAIRAKFFAIVKEARALNSEARKTHYTAKMKTETGPAELDELIESIGDKTGDAMAQATCRAALEARFDLNVKIPEGLSVELLPRLYKLFQHLPVDHAINDMMQNLEYGTETGDAHYYDKSGKRILLLADLGKDSDQDYVCQETGAKATVKYFNATVLHEIGHGVDAKKDVTKAARMEKSGFGQWRKESLGSVITAIYEAVFRKHTGSGKEATEADLKAMLTRLLTSGTCEKPASADGPLGSLLSEWESISGEPAFTWCPGFRDGQQPWKNRHEIGGRVYQECYEDDWWSYDLGERSSTGISDYQWRATPEWFAEAYALYHMNKVKKFPDEINEFVMGQKSEK